MLQNTVSWASAIPSLFAIIIGIDFYESKDFPRLSGAVRDALAYKAYLTDYLKVPEDQIKVLINQQASRASILKALSSLKEDPRIKEGDPIFVFYAGHGAEINGPPGWDSGGSKCKIQMLVPQNYCAFKGLEIPGIPDRTIGALLEDIAEKKGNNITVVLDCCHSSSATRGPNGRLTGRARSVILKPSIHTKYLDREIWHKGTKVSHPVPRFRFSGLRSHILIAACHSSELARETQNSGSGRFSVAFLKLLRSVPPDKLRYSEILIRMDHISGQNPQIEGVDQERYLFDAKIHLPSPPSYPLRYDAKQCSFFMDAGTAHGVTTGTEFAAMQKQDVGIPIGTLIVEQATPFSSTVKVDPQLSTLLASTYPITTAIQTRPGKREDLRLYIPPEPNYSTSLKFLRSLLQANTHDLHNIVLVNDPALAHLEISIESGRLSPLLIDNRATQYGFYSQLPTLSTHENEIVPFFRSAARYFWELDRKSDNPGLMDSIEVSFYELQECRSPFEEVARPEMSPIGCNLFQDSKVTIVGEEQRFYGIKLTNNGYRDLYPSLLYFDNTDLTDIVAYYKPPSSGPYLPESPLKKGGGTLTIGYGSGGMAPLSYSLPEGQAIAIGFLKIFVFTRPLDTSACFPTRLEKWDTLLIPIIQRRYRVCTPPIRYANVWPMPHVHSMNRRTASLPI